MSYLDDPVYAAVSRLRGPAYCLPMLRRVVPGGVATAAPEGIRLDYLNYKPFERARLVLSLARGGAEEPRDGFVFEVQGRGRVADDGRNGGDDSSGFAIPSLGARGWRLDRAPGLEALACLCARPGPPGGVRRALGLGTGPVQVDLLRCVPRKRAVLTLSALGGDSRIFAKLGRPDDTPALAACFEAVGRVARLRGFAFRAPEVLMHDARLNAVFMSEVPGRSFTGCIGRADTAAFAALGTALASLHRSRLRPDAVWTTADQLGDLRRHMAGMARALPRLRHRLDALVARLGALEPEPFEGKGRPIHGNLFGDQVLWDGARIGIVDWDRLAWGDPLYDVGRMLAHQIYESAVGGVPPGAARACADALVTSFGRAANCRVDGQRLTWHVAVELLLRAKISALRPLSADWPARCALAVAECERLIGGSCAFAALMPAERMPHHAA